MERIVKWLNSDRDYQEGLALLFKFSHNRILLQRLSRKNKEWPEKLAYELKKVLAANNNPAALAKLKKDEPKKPSTIQKMASEHSQIVVEGPKRVKIVRDTIEVKLEDLPNDIRAKVEQNYDLYSKQRSLHEKLKLMITEEYTDTDREDVAQEIRKTDAVIRNNWEIVDAWNPKTEKEESVKASLDHKNIQAARTYISKNKKKLSDTDQKEKFLPKVQERVTLLVKAGENFENETKEKLTALGIKFEK